MIKVDYLRAGINSLLEISTVCIDPIKLNHKWRVVVLMHY